MLRGWGVAFDSNGVLKKILSKDGWDSGAAVFEVDRAEQFEASFSFGERNLPLIVGITKHSIVGGMKEKPGRDEDLPKMFVKANGSACFLFVDDDGTAHALNYDDNSTPEVLIRIDNLPKIDSKLVVRYEDGAVSFSTGDKTLGPLKVPEHDGKHYRPCLFIHEKQTSVKVALKRKRTEPQESLGERMWKSRRYTDASLSCGSRKVHVHREVLSAASPVFERMWASAYREAGESNVEITDIAEDVVEAMLQHMYTGSIPAQGDPAQLYGAAKKYELNGLAEEVGGRLLEHLDKGNVQERARLLRLHAGAGDAQAKSLWERLYAKLQKDPKLLKLLVEGLLP